MLLVANVKLCYDDKMKNFVFWEKAETNKTKQL